MIAKLPLLGLLGIASGAIVERWINITEVTTNPDGLFDKLAIGINGTWPPPILIANENDTIIVHAYNSLDHMTSIHHHGMFFPNTSHYDGAASVSFCGHPPNTWMDYVIPLDKWPQHGTYWWHSHTGRDYVDGLRAPFIIHPAQEPHQYDDEFIIALSDWYHTPYDELYKDKFMSIFNPTGAEPIPDSALMYAAYANGTYIPGFNSDMKLPFEPGKTYRLRLLNIGGFTMFYNWLDGHTMRVIEVDGTDVEEYEVDYLSISVAQRYSVLVTARNDTGMNYLFHNRIDENMLDTLPPELVLNYTSTIEYNPNSPTQEGSVMDELEMTDDFGFVPTEVEAQLTPVTKQIELGVFFDTFDDGTNRAAFNNITWSMPGSTPSLFTQLSMGDNASLPEVYGKQTHAFVLEENDIVDLQVINWDANAHPFHLHGHKFQFVRRATDVASDDPEDNPPHVEDLPNPMRRDTVAIPDGGAVNIRFRADNPGAWMFHCHIEWHMEAGLVVVFIEAPKQAQQNIQLPPALIEQCKMLDKGYTGNIVGLYSTTDFKGQKEGPYPQVLGFHARGIGAMTGCVLAFVLGALTIIWYAFVGEQLDAKDVEEEVQRQIALKEQKTSLKEKATNLFNKK